MNESDLTVLEDGSIRILSERGLVAGLKVKGALEESVLVDLSSRALLAKSSLLEMIRGLIVGGLNFIIKKKGSKNVNVTPDVHNRRKIYVKTVKK